MLDEAGEAKGRLWKALYKGKKKKFVKTIKAIRKCAPNEKAVNDCEEYLLNNWDSAVRRMQDKKCLWMQCRRSCEVICIPTG